MSIYSECALREIANVQLGMAFKTAIVDVGELGKCYLIQPKNINEEGRIEPGGLSRVTPSGEAGPHVLNVDDIVLRLRGPVFSALIVDSQMDLPLIATNQCAVIRCDREYVAPYYLHWYLNSLYGRRYFEGVREGTNINKISAQVVSNMRLSLPGIHKQQKIADVNRNWLRQRYLYRRLIDNGDRIVDDVCKKLQSGEV